MKGARRQGRILALQGMYAWSVFPCEIKELLSYPWAEEKVRNNLPAVAFADKLVKGTIESCDRIDGSIRRCLDHWDFNRIYSVDLALLRVSGYEILCLPDIPVSVVINEAVEISKRFSVPDSYGFINGILDKMSEERNGSCT